MQNRLTRARQCFGQWKEHYVEAKRQTWLTIHVVQPWYRQRLMRKVISSWKTRSRLAALESRDTFWKGQLKIVSESLVEQYERELSQLRITAHECREEAELHRQAKERLQQDMKLAFVRGVCKYSC